MEVNRKTNPSVRAFGLVLFILPVMYGSSILSAAVHEILGHGLCAVLLGGDFTGFVLRWDGMGWAYASLPETASIAYQTLFLASGIFANIICGVILLWLASSVPKKPHVQLALLIVSFTCLIDGVSYVLWNAYHPVPPGDVGTIIGLWSGSLPPEESTVRWVLLVAGALLSAGTTFCLCIAIFKRVEALILHGSQFTGGSRLLALTVLLVLPGAVGWFVFDWDQVMPGIGRLPCVVGALSVIAVAGVLYWYRPKWKGSDCAYPIPHHHIAASWMCLVVTVLGLALWFADGVQSGAGRETSRPRLIGPLTVSGSGRFLFCGVRRSDTDGCYMVVPLRRDRREPEVLSFPGSDRCLGAMWRPGADLDELLFVTGGKPQVIRRLRVSDFGIEEMSSYPVDPSLLAAVPSSSWSSGGKVFALRVATFKKGVFSGSYLGFSNDDGRTIHVTTIVPPSELLWAADNILYVTHAGDVNEVILSKAELDLASMAVEMREIRREDSIVLATQPLDGSVVYAVKDSLLRDHEVFASLPEEVGYLCVDGSHLMAVSMHGRGVFVLDATGEIVDTWQIPEGSICIGFSWANGSAYLTASSPEGRTHVDVYDFVEKRESRLFEAKCDTP